jgi:sugar phosphate isomerase/epimerase
MKLAISNIAWPEQLDESVTELMLGRGLTGVELAPTKIWREPLAASSKEVLACRDTWESRGLPIVALQSLLFGKNELQVFAPPAQQAETFAYLAGMIRLAAALGAGVLVFGSPKNRLVGQMPPGEVRQQAVAFFRRLGQVAQEHGVWFCIEPNPTHYGCDFVTTAEQGIELVAEVDQPGFGLHLDAAGMTLAGDDVLAAFRQAGHWWRHLHISEPYLQPVGTGQSQHAAIAQALGQVDYAGWLSIEMKPPAEGTELTQVAASLDFCIEQYSLPRRAAA